jgi:hypothetical protein
MIIHSLIDNTTKAFYLEKEEEKWKVGKTSEITPRTEESAARM